MSSPSFASLDLRPELQQNIASLGYPSMTPIQAQSLPHILEGKDVIGQGQTGSGKTAAFGLGILQNIAVDKLAIQALVICPTRELADQVATEIRKLARILPNIKVLTICGGTPIRPQSASLAHGAHIVVGTPGRIQDHLEKETLKGDSLKILVLDEGDRMLDMGFYDALIAITDKLPTQRQTLLFSATYPDKIKTIAGRIMQKPVMVEVSSTHDINTIEQVFYKVKDDAHRFSCLCALILKNKPESTLVFCNTKLDTQELSDKLSQYGFSALALNGDLEQKDRDQTLIQFANKSISILVATDVAARGLDIDSVDMVINYHIAHNTEAHTHRIGRTGRAGRKGMAYSFYSNGETHKVSALNLDESIITSNQTLPMVEPSKNIAFKPAYITLRIDSGKKQKIRAGDILGALTGERGIAGENVGKINVFNDWSYVAVRRNVSSEALKRLNEGKLKGRSCRARVVGS